jgi:hypothetical protein
VQAALDEALAGRTTIVIAHRLSTVRAGARGREPSREPGTHPVASRSITAVM